MPPQNINETLNERGKRYGGFAENARLAQRFKTLLHSGESWKEMPAHGKEALEMITGKICRILNGDPSYADSWIDIAGYAQLEVKVLGEEQDAVRTPAEIVRDKQKEMSAPWRPPHRVGWVELYEMLALPEVPPNKCWRVFGIPRGGKIVAGLMLIKFGVSRMQIVEKVEEAELIVDDVRETGETLGRYLAPNKEGKYFYTPFDKLYNEKLRGLWLVFPWENSEDPQRRDND